MPYLALMLTSAAATAAEIGVSPTSVALDPAHLVRSVQLRNSAAMPLRIEVAIKRWSQRRDGSWDLTDLAGPSDLIVHPLNFDVAPGAAQLVRVGVSRPPAAGPEQAYRLILRELPPESGLHSATGLSILSELTLPVFVSDGSARAEPALESEAIEQGRWRYRLLAGERGHLSPTEASLRLFDATGALLSTRPVSQGYVLAGAGLPVEVTLDPATCEKAARYELAVLDGVLEGPLPAVPRTCGP
jgi:fimbrial chaperone protein